MKSIIKKISLTIYLGLTATFYIFIEFGLFSSVTTYLQYALICCNFAFGILALVLDFKKEKIFITVGLLFTLLADSGLVMYLYPNYQLVGMCFFSITQIAYFLYIFYTCKDPKVNAINVIARLAACTIAIIVTIIVSNNALVVVSAFYFINLICNIVFAFISFKNNKLFAIGLALFIFCDIYVGLGTGADMGIFTAVEGTFAYNFFFYPSINMAWLFYIPSQALITLSLIDSLD